MLIQWDEPETPNGQVTVSSFVFVSVFRSRGTTVTIPVIFRVPGIQGILHDGFESTNGVLGIQDGGQ